MIFKPTWHFETGCASYLLVYPGHFAGSACGVGLSGKPSSTIGFERRWNSLLSADADAFVAALSDAGPKPAEMDQILRFNRGRIE